MRCIEEHLMCGKSRFACRSCAVQFHRAVLAFSVGILAGIPALSAQVFLDQVLTLVPDEPGINRMTLEVTTTALGSDSDTTMFRGELVTDLTLDGDAGQGFAVDAMSITGGEVFATDVSFSLLFVTATSSGLGGVPGTLQPPGLVTAGTFNAADHFIQLNQGSLSALGTTFDFAQSPVLASGVGQGSIVVTAANPVPGFEVFEVTVDLPVAVNETFDVPNVPVLGTVPVTLTGETLIRASGTIAIPLLAGDYNADGDLGCADIDLLGAAIRGGSQDVLFDANGDGAVDAADYQAWVTELKGTVIGDANFDLVNDTSDFNLWSESKFTSGTGWCEGDFNGDGVTDVADFNEWNIHRFTSATGVVPEPSGGAGILVAGLLGMAGCRGARSRGQRAHGRRFSASEIVGAALAARRVAYKRHS